jgi:hypothetical protein
VARRLEVNGTDEMKTEDIVFTYTTCNHYRTPLRPCAPNSPLVLIEALDRAL